MINLQYRKPVSFMPRIPEISRNREQSFPVVLGHALCGLRQGTEFPAFFFTSDSLVISMPPIASLVYASASGSRKKIRVFNYEFG
jgi:hypothetical protein